ncbi:SAV_2336 N-terminal domain-related protein [Streptomyces sp. RPA4-5]|uniref:SAV_2336 N-terminal domain-related protein n=1 Tax=Streptomyces sp. RPA4-5 TaxID=2721245 RepID=UPI002001DFBD|nr:SAV_2336 N-terminal domain-related protein [Streptomyces sp. RPA4-5]
MPPGEPGPGPLDELVARLTAAGLPADARGMADALWLAQWITPGPSRAQSAADAGPTHGDPPDRTDSATFRVGPSASAESAGTGGAAPDGSGTETADGDPAPPVLQEGTRRRVAELLPTRDPGDARFPDPDRQRLGEVAVPIASAFPGLLPLQRALRPIQRYRPPVAPVPRRLDEPATAELSAHAEMIIPVLRGVHRRAAGLRLLMDGSSSMAVWEQMLHDLRQVCERVGAFRDVTVHYLHPHGPDVGVAAAPGPGRPLRPADQLHDPTGHHLTLVVSDCAGPLWRDGRMQRLLYRWAADAPLAVVQPLPQRMWARTLLPAVAGTLVRRQGPYQALGFRPARRRRRPAGPPGAAEAPRERAVPVLSATPSALGSWARLAAADAGLSLRRGLRRPGRPRRRASGRTAARVRDGRAGPYGPRVRPAGLTGRPAARRASVGRAARAARHPARPARDAAADRPGRAGGGAAQRPGHATPAGRAAVGGAGRGERPLVRLRARCTR